MTRLPLCLLAAAVLAGCAQTVAPSDAQLAAADYGAEPTAEQAQAAVRRYYQATLRDPGSAQLAGWTTPQRFWWGQRDQSHYGYLVCVEVNAKNAFGGYVGFRRDGFLLRDGRVLRHFPSGQYGASGQVCRPS